MRSLVAAVLLGVLLAVVVPMLLALFQEGVVNARCAEYLLRPDDGWIFVLQQDRFGSTRISAAAAGHLSREAWALPRGNAPYWSRAAQDMLPPDRQDPQDFTGPVRTPIDEARGWPFRSVYWHADELWRWSSGRQAIDIEVKHGIRVPLLETTADVTRAVPLGIIWRGMFGNVLFYCITCACVVLGTRSLWHKRRVEQGRCPSCGYDLRGELVAGCPECGWGRCGDGAAAQEGSGA